MFADLMTELQPRRHQSCSTITRHAPTPHHSCSAGVIAHNVSVPEIADPVI